MIIVQAVISHQKLFISQAQRTEKFIVHRLQKIKNRKTLLTCGKLKSDCLNKTKTQTSTYEFNLPASDNKLKLSSNPVGQGLQNETMLI
jgi:hypothetical protein